MKLFHRLPVFYLTFILSCTQANARFSLTTLKNKFFPKIEETKTEQSYQLEDKGTIELKNINGNVEIYSSAAQNTVTVQTTKCAPQEELALISTPTHFENTTLSLETIYDKPVKKSCVNYKIGLPSTTTTNLCLTNKKGKMTINNCTGTINAKNGYGNLAIANAADTVVAKVLKRGNITIKGPRGHVKVSTNQGKISIDQSKNSITAEAKNGNITVCAATVPKDTKIKLKNTRGNISLTLPEEIDAKISASSTRGKVTCQHQVTLQPNTTALDSAAWEQFKQSVNGTIGNGKSQIVVHSEKSNITINKEQKKKA